MIDKKSNTLYTQITDLDNEIQEEALPTMEGDFIMGRQRIHITLPSGEPVWITGNTFNELIQNALEKYGNPNAVSSSSETFQEYTDRIFDIFLRPRWKESTAGTNRFLLDKHISPYFGGLVLSKIDTATVQKFFQSKQHLSKSYTKQMLIMLHEIFENAVEDHIIKEDPTQSKRITLPQKVAKRSALEDYQYQDIISHLSELESDEALFMALLCFTGMRRGEILGLKWDYVQEDQIIVRSEIIFKGNSPIYHEYTKSAAGIRKIPIQNELKPFLEKRGRGFVFGADKPYSQCKFTRMWERIGKKINLYGATPHVFRHTYLTMLAASGVDPKTIQVIAGHSDFSFTFNKYIDKSGRNVQDAGDQLSCYMQKLTKKLSQNGSSDVNVFNGLNNQNGNKS